VVCREKIALPVLGKSDSEKVDSANRKDDAILSDVDLEELSYPELKHWAKIFGVNQSSN